MIRDYNEQDKSDVIEIIRLNTPKFFHSSEEKDFIHYLENRIEEFYVIEFKSNIIGCGGINYLLNERIVKISWDMFHPNFQNKGLGTSFVKYRINRIKKNKNKNDIVDVVVRTCQLTYRFYEKMGFKLKRVEKDFFAEGFDLYFMTMKINNIYKNKLYEFEYLSTKEK